MRQFGNAPLRCVLAGILWCTSCGNARVADDRFVLLDLGQRATDEFIGYYVQPFSDGPEDPFESRLVIREGGSYYVDMERLAARDSLGAKTLLELADDRRRIDEHSFDEFIARTYYRVRRIPEDLATLRSAERFDPDSPEWLRTELVGVMSTQRRRIYTRMADVVSALRAYRDNEDRIIYPPGTVFIGEHLDGDRVSETTVMRKSAALGWDFFAYDTDGRRADSTLARPRSRKVPTQCVGCHFGDKLYEPERSFPALAPDGPHGPRRLFVPEILRDVEVVQYFDEHRKRSDGVLGLYATLLVAQFRADRDRSDLSQDRAAILESLGL